MTESIPLPEASFAVVPDFESFKVKLIVADDYAKYSTDFPILENIENREYYGRSASQIKGRFRFRFIQLRQ